MSMRADRGGPDLAPPALLWEARPDGTVVCQLCAHRCRIRAGLRGICGVRENRAGRLVSRVADRVVSAEIDPIEKKPFFHVLPGSRAYSIATVGCNLHCRFCQNWAISQWPHAHPDTIPGQVVSASAMVAAARTAGCASIAYTYTEPTIFLELALETCERAVLAGLRNLFVTNGYMTAETLALLAPVLHAANVDLKSFSDRYYRSICGATLAPVLDTIRRMRELGIWVELTTLLVPGRNDSDAELSALARWIAALDRDTPWHVSAFYPAYRMLDLPPTPVSTLHRAAALGRAAGLRHVYTGNVPGDAWENTTCPGCDAVVIRRRGYHVLDNVLVDGRCPACRAPVAGIWGTGRAVQAVA